MPRLGMGENGQGHQGEEPYDCSSCGTLHYSTIEMVACHMGEEAHSCPASLH